MSENENQPPTPSKQTSSVPLKKETVRVTLKAADAPAVPSATVPMAPPVRPPVPGAPSAPTAPPVAGSKPTTAPAPTIPLRTAGPPAGASPAPTIKLATSAAPIGTGALRPGGIPTAPGGSPTLPKATVQLQAPTQPLGPTSASASQAATFRMEDDEEEVEAHEGLVKVLSGVGFVAALAVLVFQLMLADKWISVGSDHNPNPGNWSAILD